MNPTANIVAIMSMFFGFFFLDQSILSKEPKTDSSLNS